MAEPPVGRAGKVEQAVKRLEAISKALGGAYPGDTFRPARLRAKERA
jgi:hypothetical protein